MDSTLAQEIEDFAKDPSHAKNIGEPVSEELIEEAEKRLSVKFDNTYKEILRTYGGSYLKFPIYGFNNCQLLSNNSVVDLTEQFREKYHNEVTHTLSKAYVISQSGSGDPILITKDGSIVEYAHDYQSITELYNSLDELLEVLFT